MPAYRYVSGVGYVRTGSADLGVEPVEAKPIPNPTSTPDQLRALGQPPDADRVPTGAGRDVEAWITTPTDPAERARRARLALEHETGRAGGARAGVKATATKAIEAHQPDPEPDPDPDSDDDQDDDESSDDPSD